MDTKQIEALIEHVKDVKAKQAEIEATLVVLTEQVALGERVIAAEDALLHRLRQSHATNDALVAGR
jgi:hypothetical protein